MRAAVDWPCSDLLTRRAATAPEGTAAIDAEAGERWTARALSNGPVDALAAGIRDLGLAPGDHLGAVIEPGIEVVQLVHAAARAGVVFVPLPPDAPPAVIGARCDAADVEALVADESMDANPSVIGAPIHRLDAVPTPEGTVEPHRWAPDDRQWLVFTSGTTGEPRPVGLTAGNLVASATASARRLGVDPEDRWLACLPTHHVGGLAPAVRTALSGTAVVTQAGFDVTDTARAMVEHAVTGVSLVPTMLDRLLDDGWRPPAGLRFVLLGGAPTAPALVERCEAAGVPVCPTYGATETASQVATATPAEAVANPGTVGRPLDGVDVEVRSARGEPGEIVVAGPTVSPGYYADQAATDDRFESGTFHTRDRGYRDEAGRLFVLGRLDDAVVTGGETVHPDVVEAALRGHPAVDDAAVVGLDDEAWGEVVAAVVTGPAGTTIDPQAVRDRCRAELDPPAVPTLIVPVESVPRTASGTVDRGAVRETLRADREGL